MVVHEALKLRRTADALRYAGARMSTVGRRVVVSGKQTPLGRPLDRSFEAPARNVLRRERQPAPVQPIGIAICTGHARTQPCGVRCGHRVPAPGRNGHWSEVDE